jgi:hypothetical protein
VAIFTAVITTMGIPKICMRTGPETNLPVSRAPRNEPTGADRDEDSWQLQVDPGGGQVRDQRGEARQGEGDRFDPGGEPGLVAGENQHPHPQELRGRRRGARPDLGGEGLGSQDTVGELGPLSREPELSILLRGEGRAGVHPPLGDCTNDGVAGAPSPGRGLRNRPEA